MAVQYAPTKLRVPPGFQNLLEGVSREVLREQPANIIQFAANYFKNQLAIRDDTGTDDASRGSNMEKLMNEEEIDIDLNDPSTADAAVKIQAVFRGHKGRQEKKQKKEEENAATKIQAGFRGHQARKSVREMKSSSTMSKEDQAETDDGVDKDEKEYVESVIENEGVNKPLDDSKFEYAEEKYEEAATKIQAGFRGYKSREELKGSRSGIDQDSAEQNGFETTDVENEGAADDVDGEQQEEAAVKIQASFRGHKARREVNAMRSASDESVTTAEVDDDANGQAEAATKIQAGYRGYVARKEVDEMKASKSQEDASQADAAVKIQAGYRGYVARKEVDELKASQSNEIATAEGDAEPIFYDDDENERAKAATRIQASYRGYKTRASMNMDKPPDLNQGQTDELQGSEEKDEASAIPAENDTAPE